MRAVVVAVRDHPEMNARFDDEGGVIERHRAVHLGIAVQTPRGLMVPVVKDADRPRPVVVRGRGHPPLRSRPQRQGDAPGAVRLDDHDHQPRCARRHRDDTGHQRPEVAIIGVNKIVTRPVYVDGAFVPRKVMNLSSSFDHRVVDGADAAAFIQRIRALLEHPALLFMD